VLKVEDLVVEVLRPQLPSKQSQQRLYTFMLVVRVHQVMVLLVVITAVELLVLVTTMKDQVEEQQILELAFCLQIALLSPVAVVEPVVGLVVQEVQLRPLQETLVVMVKG
jgi:lysylphosphatidylglycerol synthetase-like protein (DUF2156 family)